MTQSPHLTYDHDLDLLLENLETGQRPHLARSHQVFVNRDVHMDQIDAIGFDMDYTLALYRQEALDALSVEKTLERLVKVKNYAPSILSIKPNPSFAIRGLVIDKEEGNILKIDADRRVVKAFHGFKEVAQVDRHGYTRATLRSTKGRYHLIDTLFALPEAFLYAALIDHFEEQHGGLPVSYLQLFDDIRACIDLAHRDNSLKDAIMADLDGYIHRDPNLAATLHRLRSAGKRLFLMTNSRWRYTECVMRHLLDNQLDDYPSWRHYFDAIITAATKPTFFTGRRPFLKLDDQGIIVGQATDTLERGVFYQGGNLADFERLTGWGTERVLYVGDHIYGDILKSKKTSSWRSCMLVQEMAAELRHAHDIQPQLTRSHELEAELHRVNQQLHYEHHTLQRLNIALEEHNTTPLPQNTLKTLQNAIPTTRHRRDNLTRRRKEIVRVLLELDRTIEAHFNPYWGQIFKASNEHSIFASQVSLYADLYTSAVSNFLAYSPIQYFRAPKPLMPHELAL